MVSFKSPKFMDLEGDSVLISFSYERDDPAVTCEAKLDNFECFVNTGLVTLENKGAQTVTVTVQDDGSLIREPPNEIEFVIEIEYIESEEETVEN